MEGGQQADPFYACDLAVFVLACVLFHSVCLFVDCIILAKTPRTVNLGWGCTALTQEYADVRNSDGRLDHQRYTGSFVFHLTMSRWGQLADQLPMIYGAIYLHHIISEDNFKTRMTCFLLVRIVFMQPSSELNNTKHQPLLLQC